MNNLLLVSDYGCAIILALLDLNAALDPTEHILIIKLEDMGWFDSKYLAWYGSYLTTRQLLASTDILQSLNMMYHKVLFKPPGLCNSET